MKIDADEPSARQVDPPRKQGRPSTAVPSRRTSARDLRQLAAHHHVLIKTDSVFQRHARLLQSLWRRDQGLAMGTHGAVPLGSRLPMPDARDTLSAYLTETIQTVVRREVLDTAKADGKLYGTPRIFNDLLSSQPLCFNLFGELQCDLEAATRTLRRRVPTMAAVTAIEFEWSPGRDDTRFTSDRSAFDVFVTYDTIRGGRGFVGIEVKYHENLRDKAASHKPRYDEVATGMGCFVDQRRADLRRRPLQQVWRDHLLAGSMLLPDAGLGFSEGRFVFLYPRPNIPCQRAVDAYRECLSDSATFDAWTLEGLVADLRSEQVGSWVELVDARYLDWDRVGALLETVATR